LVNKRNKPKEKENSKAILKGKTYNEMADEDDYGIET